MELYCGLHKTPHGSQLAWHSRPHTYSAPCSEHNSEKNENNAKEQQHQPFPKKHVELGHTNHTSFSSFSTCSTISSGVCCLTSRLSSVKRAPYTDPIAVSAQDEIGVVIFISTSIGSCVYKQWYHALRYPCTGEYIQYTRTFFFH